jgi:hypothetical protein
MKGFKRFHGEKIVYRDLNISFFVQIASISSQLQAKLKEKQEKVLELQKKYLFLLRQNQNNKMSDNSYISR